MNLKNSEKLNFSFTFLLSFFVFLNFAHAYSVKATREGLVGGITSNGHTIVSYDWFVALPSVKNLAKNNSWDTPYGVNQSTPVRVRVTYNGRSVIAPVWDVGPWNTKDDYWNSNSARSIYSAMNSYWASNSAPKSPELPPGWDPSIYPVPPANALLAIGNPQATHAYNTSAIFSTASYNYGCDQFGRHRWFTANRLNGSGIDLADGVFWKGLQMTGNFTVSWDFTSELPQVKRVLITSGSVILYDSQNQISQPIVAGSTLTIKILFSVTLSTNPPQVSYSTGSTIFSAGSGSFSQTSYLLDTWTTNLFIPPDAPKALYTLSIDARDPGNNQMDSDENNASYNPGVNRLHKLNIQSPPPASSANYVLISQIATRGSASASDEFVELYNPTANSISIAGWQLQYLSATGTTWSNRLTFPQGASIPANGYYLTANSAGYVSGTSGPAPDSWWGTTTGIADDGHLRIVDATGKEIDRVGYGTASQPEGGTPGAPNHGTTANSKSIGRKTDGLDTNSNQSDFEIRSARNPKISATTTPPSPSQVTANYPLISQFATRGSASASDEFVELYNPTTFPISLSGWKLEYLSASGTSWSSRLLFPSGIYLSPQKFFLTANSTGYISGATGPAPDLWWTTTASIADNGHLRIIDANGNEIDRVGYGTASQPEGGTPGAPNHGTTANSQSVARSILNKESNVNRNDFVVLSMRNPRNSYSLTTSRTSPDSSSTNTDTPTQTQALPNSGESTAPQGTPFFQPAQPEDFALREIFVYPNPVYGAQGQKPTFRLEIGKADRIEIRIYTIAAELVHSAELPTNLQLKDNKWVYEYSGWDISGIASGVYIYLVRAERSGFPLIKVVKKIAIIK